MLKKFIAITLITAFLLILTISTYSYANTQAGNAVMNAGNSIGNAAMSVKNGVVNGVKSIGNGATRIANDSMNATEDMTNDATNTIEGTTGILDNGNDDYTATRTATNNNILGMSDTTWTWLILGIVGLSIVGLVWYYGAQYEHRNYEND